jgi:hypothetical protein
MNETNLDIAGIRIARIRKDGKAIELGVKTDNNRTLNLTIPMEQAEQITDLFVRACTSAKITQAARPPQDVDKQSWKPTPEIVFADEVQFVAQHASGYTYLVVLTQEGKELQISLEVDQLRLLIELAQRAENTQISNGIH